MVWNAFLETKILMRGGSNPPLKPFPRRCLRRRFKSLVLSAPPRKQPLWVQPFFFTYVSLYFYGNVLCMIQTLIYIYS